MNYIGIEQLNRATLSIAYRGVVSCVLPHCAILMARFLLILNSSKEKLKC